MQATVQVRRHVINGCIGGVTNVQLLICVIMFTCPPAPILLIMLLLDIGRLVVCQVLMCNAHAGSRS